MRVGARGNHTDVEIWTALCTCILDTGKYTHTPISDFDCVERHCEIQQYCLVVLNCKNVLMLQYNLKFILFYMQCICISSQRMLAYFLQCFVLILIFMSQIETYCNAPVYRFWSVHLHKL